MQRRLEHRLLRFDAGTFVSKPAAVYFNAFSASASPTDFTLEFGQAGAKPEDNALVARLITTPLMFKKFITSGAELLRQHEEKHGPIGERSLITVPTPKLGQH